MPDQPIRAGGSMNNWLANNAGRIGEYTILWWNRHLLRVSTNHEPGYHFP
jgi:hypothetical protein